MLTEERFHAILKLLEEQKAVTVTELTERLDASESTIRRDLVMLNKMGKLNKVYGGATALSAGYNTKDDAVAVRREWNVEEKTKIARYAASLIQKNDFVYIDAGTTTGLMLNFIGQTQAVFVTNGLYHARTLSKLGCKTFLIGGELKFATEAVVGSEALLALEKYNFTKGFFGTNGVNIKAGYSTPDVSEAMVKSRALARCRDAFVLADQSKEGKISPATFSPLSAASLITHHLENKAIGEYTKVIALDVMLGEE